MFKNSIGKLGFLIAGNIFLIVAIIPFVQGGAVKVSFFVIAIALLVTGIAIVHKRHEDTSLKK